MLYRHRIPSFNYTKGKKTKFPAFTKLTFEPRILSGSSNDSGGNRGSAI